MSYIGASFGIPSMFFWQWLDCDTFTWSFWFQTCRVGSHHHQAALFWLPTCFHGAMAFDLRNAGWQTLEPGHKLTGKRLPGHSHMTPRKSNGEHPLNQSVKIFTPEGMSSNGRGRAMMGDDGWCEAKWNPGYVFFFIQLSPFMRFTPCHFQHAIVRPPAPTIFQPWVFASYNTGWVWYNQPL